MNIRLLLIAIIPALMILSPLDATQQLQVSRKIVLSGQVTRVSRENVDKSGKNPKYMVRFSLKIDSVDDPLSGFAVNSTVKCVAREKKIITMLGRTVQEGDKISVFSEMVEKSPQLIAVSKIEFKK